MDTTNIVKRMFWLAWNACGGPMGMGFLQDNPDVTEDDIWQNVMGPGDYAISHSKPGSAYGDYVFGRMMKLTIKWDKDKVNISEAEPQPDYQAWCLEYPSYQALYDAAVESLK